MIRALDGDTIEVRVTARATIRLPGRTLEFSTSDIQTVRIAGVNAPELKKPQCAAESDAARAAKRYLEERLTGESLTLVTRGTELEKYGRTLADIEVRGQSLSRDLILRGLADPYDGEKRDPQRWCGGSDASY